MINKKLDKIIEKEVAQELLKEFKNLASVDDLNKFFSKFMTDIEKRTIFRRIASIKLLSQGKKYREIKDLLGISGNTISNTKDILAGRGYSRNPNRKIKYSPLTVLKKTRKKYGLRYKGAESIF